MFRNQKSMIIPFNDIGNFSKEKMFEKFFLTVVIDDYNRMFDKKAIEEYGEKITDAIAFTEPLKMWRIYNSKSRSSLEEKSRNIVSKVAQRIAEKIADNFMKPRAGVLDTR